jgi:DNA invertase Pin-like site-specific DNA recombinase
MRAVIYLRQSQDLTGLAAAVERQREDCLELAAARGWIVVGEEVDNDTSALARHRPGFDAVVARVRAGGVDVVVAWHVDRLVRRLADLEPLLAVCESAGVRIATVTGDLDLGTDTGRLVARILGSVAQAEIERKSVRQRRAHRQRAAAGHVKLLRRPFGYELDGRVNRSEAAALRRIVAEYLDEDLSVTQAVRRLNDRGVTTSTGARWTPTSLIRVLRNPRYAGVATYHGEPVGVGDWTPMLTAATHEALLARLDDPVRLSRFATPGRKHLLSGIARCGVCGERVGSSGMPTRTGGGPSYRCPRFHVYRAVDALDTVVTRAVLARLAAPDALELLVGTPGEDARHARRELLACRAEQAQAATLFTDGVITRAQLAAMSTRLRARERDLERAWALQARPAAMAKILLTTAHARPRRHLRAGWDRLTLDEQRAVIDTLLVVSLPRVGPGRRCGPDNVDLEWRTSDVETPRRRVPTLGV